jgi:AraC-like DNA-binding protein
MLSILAVNFDNFIANWHNRSETLKNHILVLVLQGKVVYTLNGKTVIAEPEHLLLFPRGTTRAAQNDPSGPHQKYTVCFNYAGDEADIPFPAYPQYLHIKIRNFEHVKRRFELIHRECLENKRYSQWIALGALQELLGTVGRETELTEISPMKWKLAKTMQQYLLERYRQPVRVNELAALIRRSPNYTVTLFTEAIGLPPIQYMHQLRIAEACGLLTNSDMTVAEIAGYLGYYDTSYFVKIFKKFTSMSPTAYATNGNARNMTV